MAISLIRSILKRSADQPHIEVPALVLGDSHAVVLARAIESTKNDLIVSVDVRPGSVESKINTDLFDFYKTDKLILAFGGTEHNIIGLIEAEPKFDFLWPPFDDFDMERTLIPASAIEEMIGLRMRGGLKRALRAREMFDCPAYAIAPPPPFLAIDEKTILPKAFFALLEAGVAPAPLRRKLYAVQCALMKALYEEHGITFIEAPRKACDKDGFLLRKFWSSDPTHGNRQYGRMLIQHLSNELGLEVKAPGKKVDV
jgi:hypothetical protein